MKKYFISVLVLIFLISFQSATSIYSISIQDINNATVSLSVFQSKRIAIVVFNPAAPNTVFLRALDSLAVEKKNIKVIAVPAQEFGTSSPASLNALSKIFSNAVLVTKPMSVKKEAGNKQHLLFKWLTDYRENRHFDVDIADPQQVFLINTKGVLHAVLQQTDKDAIRQIINQTEPE